MKRITLFYVVAGLLALGTPALRAQTTGTNQTPVLERRAQNRRVMEIVGLSRADMRGLAPEARREKLHNAIEAKVAELKQKETNGSISPLEKSDLALLEKRAHHGGKKKDKAQNTAPPVPPVQSQESQPPSQ